MTSTNIVDSKVCTKCQTNKPLTSYRTRPDRNNTTKSICRDCERVGAQQHRKTSQTYKDKERERSAGRREYIALHREANKEMYVARAKAKYESVAAKREPKSCKVHFNICEVTGKLFMARVQSARYSKEGSIIRAREYARTYHLLNRTPLPHIVKPCKECGKTFMGKSTKMYCSDICIRDSQKRVTRLDNTHQRRAKKYGVAYEPFDVIKILERDKWRCKLCGIKTPKRLRGTLDVNAPEVDHIIPLSMGGGHVPSNVQCACRRCNATKSNKIIGQLSIMC